MPTRFCTGHLLPDLPGRLLVCLSCLFCNTWFSFFLLRNLHGPSTFTACCCLTLLHFTTFLFLATLGHCPALFSSLLFPVPLLFFCLLPCPSHEICSGVWGGLFPVASCGLLPCYYTAWEVGRFPLHVPGFTFVLPITVLPGGLHALIFIPSLPT